MPKRMQGPKRFTGEYQVQARLIELGDVQYRLGIAKLHSTNITRRIVVKLSGTAAIWPSVARYPSMFAVLAPVADSVGIDSKNARLRFPTPR